MGSSLQEIYESHHALRRGRGFVLLGDARGGFIQSIIGAGKRVLDIGCRDGGLTSYFSKENTVTGIDIDADSLAHARKTLSIETREVDLNGDWGIEQGSFDAVVAAEVIEHLYYPEQVFKKINTVLTPTGVLVGTVPNAFSLAHRLRYLRGTKKGTPLADPTHINHFTVAELTERLREQFREVEVHGYGRLGFLARAFPQWFAYDLFFVGRNPVR